MGAEPGCRRSGDRRLAENTAPSTAGRSNASPRTATRCWPSTTSLPSMGSLRTTNPIESVFATVRHRTVRTKGSLSSTTARLMVFKLVIAASKTWRRLKGTNQLPKVIAGVN